MPTIAEVAQQLTADGLPVLFVDTCILLDIIRAPLRKIPACIQSAVELAEMQSKGRCRTVASSMIQNEWKTYEKAVTEELESHLTSHDQRAFAFHEACDAVKIPLSFAKASYQGVGLAAKLRDLSAGLLTNSLHLSPSDEAKSRATNRTLACVRPAKKGGGLQDCIIIEEYLELCRLLHSGAFGKKKVFCSSNTDDYQSGRKLHDSLVGEFDLVELIFTNALHWAISELRKPGGGR